MSLAIRKPAPAPGAVRVSVESAIDDAIMRVGWGVISIPPNDETPSFAYTVGLTATFRHPELMLVGFDPSGMRSLLNMAAGRVKLGVRHGDWTTDDKIIGGEIVWFRSVAARDAKKWALLADHRYGKDLDLLQMFLPDERGLFPWDSGVKAAHAKIQGVLMAGMAQRVLC
jgi:Domain of unknown function (DUF4262)